MQKQLLLPRMPDTRHAKAARDMPMTKWFGIASWCRSARFADTRRTSAPTSAAGVPSVRQKRQKNVHAAPACTKTVNSLSVANAANPSLNTAEGSAMRYESGARTSQ